MKPIRDSVFHVVSVKVMSSHLNVIVLNQPDDYVALNKTACVNHMLIICLVHWCTMNTLKTVTVPTCKYTPGVNLFTLFTTLWM